MRPRHDHDAGGDADVLTAKAAVREQVWRAMSVPGVARFPAPNGRIPNFVGAEAAARRLASTAPWQTAATVKANPDSPQWPVRAQALVDGKIVYMAVPRLTERDPFFLLDPANLADNARQASSIKGASRSARTVSLDELTPVDLVVTGCVAVGRDGARLGKGGGFSDLEFALAAAAGLIDAHTVVATTVHPLQVVDTGVIPTTAHDMHVDLIVTPDELIECRLVDTGVIPTTAHDMHVDLIVTPDELIECRRPRQHRLTTIDWSELTPGKIAAIPLLARMHDLRQ